jgi:hypothetical protein
LAAGGDRKVVRPGCRTVGVCRLANGLGETFYLPAGGGFLPRRRFTLRRSFSDATNEDGLTQDRHDQSA